MTVVPQSLLDSWTSSLPRCTASCLGREQNKAYDKHGNATSGHQFEDCVFNIVNERDNEIAFYGVFDGHDNGSQFVKFAEQKVLAEVYFHLDRNTPDQKAREVLSSAFIAVEDKFFENISNEMAERAQIRGNLEGLNDYEASRKYPDQLRRLQELDSHHLNGGASFAMAVVLGNRLFVANAGDCRVLIVRAPDPNGPLQVTQVSVQHDVRNEHECGRLRALGLSEQVVQHWPSPYCTRCLGDYRRKRSYKEIEQLSCAQDEPVIATPDITGPFVVDRSYRFMLLMTSGVYSAWEDATGSTTANADIASKVASECQMQTYLDNVAQSVLGQITRQHRATFLQFEQSLCESHEDMSLLVRLFAGQLLGGYVDEQRAANRCSLFDVDGHETIVGGAARADAESQSSQSESDEYTTDDDVTQQSSVKKPKRLRKRDRLEGKSYNLDEDGLIKPYVDFSPYFKAMEDLDPNAARASTESTT